MRGRAGFWDIDEPYVRPSEAGDPLEKLNTVVPWEVFRKPLAKALKRSDGAKGGRPPFDAVMMFKIMVFSDDQAEFQIHDRFSFMRFLGQGLGDKVPDAKTIWCLGNTLRRPGRWRTCLPGSTSTSARRAIWRWAARSWMPRSWRRRSSATAMPKDRHQGRKGAGRVAEEASQAAPEGPGRAAGR